METDNRLIEVCKESEFKHDSYFRGENDSPFITEHKWEGKIIRITGDSIVALMYNEEEDAWDELTFKRSEVANSDLDLLQNGALLNFYIGFRKINGTIKREKKIKFRRIYLGNKFDQVLDSFNKNSFSELFEEY